MEEPEAYKRKRVPKGKEGESQMKEGEGFVSKEISKRILETVSIYTMDLDPGYSPLHLLSLMS